MKRTTMLLRLRAPLALALLLALGACGKERSRDEGPVSVPVPAIAPKEPMGPMRVVVSEVSVDPTLDAQTVRGALRDAETSLVGCLDDRRAAGLVAVTFAIEPNGAVGSLVSGPRTTLSDERSRQCIERILLGLRFLGSTRSRPEVALVLEVRPPRAVE